MTCNRGVVSWRDSKTGQVQSSAHVRVVDPIFHDDRSDGVHNDDGVGAEGRDVRNERISAVP